MPKDLLKSDLRIWRETDAVGVNIILNDPEVRPWVADMGEGVIDISAAVANQNNVLLMGERGAIFFIYIMPGTYECHTQILPSGRGEWASKFAISVLDWMFSRSNAWEITTRVPTGHLGALTLARSVGFRHEFTAMDKFMFRGSMVTASILRLSIHDWATQSDYFFQLGEKLHVQMAEQAGLLGIETPAHESDQYHSQVAGAAIEMARHGLMVKAAYWYNRWAVLGRHRPIGVVSVEPPVIRMDLGDMHIQEDGIKITA